MAHVSTDLNLPNVVNKFGFTTLAIGVDAVQTSITLTNATLLSATGGVIQIEDEIIKFESKTGNVLNNCVRGIDNTTAAAHVAAVSVTSYIVAENLNALKLELQTSQGDIGQNETDLTNHAAATATHGVTEIMGTTEAQVSENKTHNKMEYSQAIDTAIGADVTITPVSIITKMTGATLSSITGIIPTDHGVVILTMATGDSVTVKNEAGTAANQIITGTGGDLLVDDTVSLFLVYDVDATKWRIVGGSGVGLLKQIANDTLLPGTDDGKVYLTNDKGIMYRWLAGWNSDFDFVKYNTAAAETGHIPGRVTWDSADGTLKLDTAFTDVSVQIGQENQTIVYNNTGVTIPNGKPVYGLGVVGGRLSVALAQSNSFLSLRFLGVTTQDIVNGAEGVVTTKGLVRDVDLSSFSNGDPIWISDTVAGGYRNTKPAAPNFSIIVGTVSDNDVSGVLNVDFRIGSTLAASSDADITGLSDRDILQYDSASFTWKNVLNSPLQTVIGMSQDKPDITLRESAGDLYLDLEKEGGGDILYFFQSGNIILDCTTGGGIGGKATVLLTEGASSSSPTNNYIYVKDVAGTATLTASTSFPTGEFCWVGTAAVPDSATFLVSGPYSFQRYSDSVDFETERGALSYERERIRQIAPSWDSGVQATTSIVTNGGGPDNVYAETTAGIVYQMHRQSFPVFPTITTDFYVANDSVSPYTVVTDLADLLTDATGDSMSARRFSLVLWGAVNKDTGDCKLYINLPVGTYNTDLDAVTDPENYAVTSIPSEFKGTGFLICRLVYRHQTSGNGTWSNIAQLVASVNNIDLRGLTPGFNLGGASTPATTEFLDDSFRVNDNVDPTKQIAFEASSISTGTTRTYTTPDKSGVVALDSDLYALVPSIETSNFIFQDKTNHIVDTEAGAITGTLPAVVDSNFVTGYEDRKRTFSTNGLTIATTGSDTVGGAASRVINDDAASAMMIADLSETNYVFSSNVVAGNGFVGGIWDSYDGLASITGVTTDPTFGTTSVSSHWRQLGENMEIYFRLRQTSAGTAGVGAYLFGVPGGRSIDLNRVVVSASTARGTRVGDASGSASGTIISGYVQGYDANNLVLIMSNDTLPISQVGSGFAPANNTPLDYTFKATIPIAEWAGTGTTNTQTQVEYAYNSDTSNADDSTSFAYGTTGINIGSYSGSTISKRVRFNEIKSTDAIILQHTSDTTGLSGWTDWGVTLFGYDRQGSFEYGAKLTRISNTDIEVDFMKDGAVSIGAYGTAGHAWSNYNTRRWRIVKHTNAALVGVEEATSEKAGVVKKNRWQTTIIGDFTSDQSNIQIFDNLKLGVTYKLQINSILQVSNSATSTVRIDVKHNNVTIGVKDRQNSTVLYNQDDNFIIFTTTVATDLLVDLTFTGTNSRHYQSQYLLEELNNYEDETTDFTP